MAVQKMRSTILLSVLSVIGLLSFGQSKSKQSNALPAPIKILWVKSLKGDFSFKNKWSYPEGVYRNEHGQLSCEGLCPTEAYAMMDSTGRIIKDSLTAFYTIVDTSHQKHTIDCKAWCYEWAGTNFIDVIKKSSTNIYCSTLLNAATHCSLQLDLLGDTCYSKIDLNSMVKGGSSIYYGTNGYITIDKTLWKKGVMKALFSFNFAHPENPKKPIYWSGKIYSSIKP